MNNSENIIKSEHQNIYQTYKRFPVVVDYAKGAYIHTKDGDEYLDFLAGIAVNALGHSHPDIIKAIEDQSKKYLHISNYFYQEPQINLAEKLCKISGMDKVFFCNSGTEATEGALKLTRKWANPLNKTQIFGFSGGFHGRSYGALSIMDKPKYKENMGPFLENMSVLPLNDVNILKNSINENTAAVVLEFLQGEGGIVEPYTDFVNELSELRNKYNFLLIADEIQSGIGRTGKFFAYQNFGIVPDIVLSAKGMGGGLPLGAIMVSSKLTDIWSQGNHGTTYGGNALACTTGKVVIDELENGLLEHVNLIGASFRERLIEIKNKYPNQVLEVRGRGLMLGLLLNYDSQILVDKLFSKKVITNAASGFVLRIVPPLIVSKHDVDLFVQKLDESLSELN